MTQDIRLSRGFSTSEANEEMSRLELGLKSAAALTLGTLPFLTANVAMRSFRGMAHLGAKTDSPVLRGLCGLLGVPAGATMTCSAKLFGLTQRLVWGHYAEKPLGDGPNTRLAWYGVSARPWSDLSALSRAFFSRSEPSPNAWTLEEWSTVRV